MAVISFEESSAGAWVVAGWAFRQLLSDTKMLFPEDLEMSEIFDRAEAVGFLRLESFEEPLANRLKVVLKETATRILSGCTQSGIVEKFQDPLATNEYLKGLGMFIDAASLLS